jgi:hypothetical protein
VKDFVTLFLEYNSAFESPNSFWLWSAYALIASTLRNNVYYNTGNDILYPNIYVLLLADSAIFRKGGSFPIVTELSNEIHHTKIYDGRASIQAILEKLSQDVGGKKGIPIRGGSCLLLAEELAAFFVADAQLIPLITNMYRSRKVFTYDLRGVGFTVKDLCVTMLAASNEIHLRDVYDEKAVYGGLLGRTFLVKPDERRNPNSLIGLDLSKYDTKELVESLHKIKQLVGTVTFTPAAKKVYETWYHELYKSLEHLPDPAGIAGRIHTSVLKLSIVVGASNYTLEIDAPHMEIAISHAVNLKPNYDSYVMASGKSSQATIGAIFLTALWNATGVNGNGNSKLSRKNFLMNFWNQVSADDLDKLIMTLTQAGMILEDYSGNELGYQLTTKAKEMFEKKKPVGGKP